MNIERIIVVILLIAGIFIAARACHYFKRRKEENHDSILTASESCQDGNKVITPCGRLEMTGFKHSVTMIVSAVNLLLTLIIIFYVKK